MYEEGGGFIHRRLNIFEEFFHKPKCRPDRCSNMNIFLPKRKNNNLLINTGTKYFPEFYQLMRMGEVDPCLAGGSCGRCECAGCAKVCKGVQRCADREQSIFNLRTLRETPGMDL